MLWLLAALAFWWAGDARAHDLWLEREGAGLVLYYGHRHSPHRGAEFIEYPADRVREALCFDETGTTIPSQAQEGYPYRLGGGCAASYVLTSSGYWTKTPYGTENVPRSQARMPVESWLSYESVKRIDRWTPELARPLVRGLEIAPLRDPSRLREGDKLRLRVTFEGRPLEAVVVAYDGRPRGRTGPDGEINIRVRHGGFQVIQASWSRPDPSDQSDQVIHSTQLNFELSED